MNGFLEILADRRRKFLDAIEANEGDISLGVFEDFYPDQAHFVFELLQNAEDAEATEAEFTLLEDGCWFEHNGTRQFSESDVSAITGIDGSTKKEAADQIGKFGIGFKSVFVYTSTPTIFSRDFSFQITKLVLPEPVHPDPLIGNRTRFWLPFNNPKKKPADAFLDIEAGLNELAETTLLFLSHLNSIRWQIGPTTFGAIQKDEHPENHIEVRRDLGGRTTSSHFLRFDQPVDGVDNRRVAIAFELAYLRDVEGFDAGKPLHTQLKIVPASAGRVAVFFPADKETSGLRFHLHAPFVPELSRASIKDAPTNRPLFQQLARLTTASLHRIRDLGLLTVEFLGVLPNPRERDSIPQRYQGICSSVIQEMTECALTPTNSRTHAPASQLLQGKAALKELLTDEDVQLLAGSVGKNSQWVASAPVDNLNATRFLEGLRMTVWDTGDFIQLLTSKLSQNEADGQDRISSDPVTDWFANKPKDWIQRLYAMIWAEYLNVDPSLQRIRRAATLKAAQIVRCQDGLNRTANECFFPQPDGEPDDGLPRVDKDVFSFGSSRRQKDEATRFLREIGVRDAGEAEQIEQILKQRYTIESVAPRPSDLSRFVALVENEPLQDRHRLFGGGFIFRCRDGKYRQPGAVFLDRPFLDTGLRAWYDVGAALHDSYCESDVGFERIVRFAQKVGARTALAVAQTTCENNPSWPDLQGSGKRRRSNSAFVDRDFDVLEFESLASNQSELTSRLIWLTMINVVRPEHLLAKYQQDRQSVPKEAPSRLVHRLVSAAWIPQTDGSFVRPADASPHLLLEGFSFDSGWPWIKAIKFGVEIARKSQDQRQVEAAAQLLGIEDIERTRRFQSLPPEEQVRILDDWERKQAIALPVDRSTNPERRAERVAAQAVDAPERVREDRTRSVLLGAKGFKEEAKRYLRERYTSDGQMICQICKDRLPFKLDDGSDYFEAIPFLVELEQRHHYQNYLALCPNHAAMYQHANGSSGSMLEKVAELDAGVLIVLLAQKELTIHFTPKHIDDLKAVIAAERTCFGRTSDEGTT